MRALLFLFCSLTTAVMSAQFPVWAHVLNRRRDGKPPKPPQKWMDKTEYTFFNITGRFICDDNYIPVYKIAVWEKDLVMDDCIACCGNGEDGCFHDHMLDPKDPAITEFNVVTGDYDDEAVITRNGHTKYNLYLTIFHDCVEEPFRFGKKHIINLGEYKKANMTYHILLGTLNMTRRGIYDRHNQVRSFHHSNSCPYKNNLLSHFFEPSFYESFKGMTIEYLGD